ncbi:MAG: hypothetical protein Q9218_004224 [Villophora microphyllina]
MDPGHAESGQLGIERLIDEKIAAFDNPYDARTEAPPSMPAYHPSFEKVEKHCENTARAAIEMLENSNYSDIVTERVLEDAKKHRKIQYPQARIIGLVGDSGVGGEKFSHQRYPWYTRSCIDSEISSLIHGSSLLTSIVKGASGAACTCVITEFCQAWPYQTEAFEAHIDLFDEPQIKTILKGHLRDYWLGNLQPEDDTDLDTLKDMRLQSDTALEVFQALFADRPEFENRVNEGEFLARMQGPDDTDILNTLLEWTIHSISKSRSFDNPVIRCGDSGQSLGKSIESFVKTSMPPGPGASPSLWPVVEVVRIGLRAPVLERGLVIADLPGLSDTNRTRTSATNRYILDCNYVFIVAPIARVQTDNAVYQRILDYTKKFGSRVSLICTKTDDVPSKVNVQEFSPTPQAMSQYHQLYTLHEELGVCKIKLSTRKKAAKGKEKANLAEELNELSLRRKVCNTLLNECFLKMRNRKVVSALRKKHRGTNATGEPLKVWCVSSVAYQTNADGFDDEDIPVSVNASGITHLRAFMLRMPAEEKMEALTTHCLGYLPSLISSLESWTVQSTAQRRKELRDAVGKPRASAEGVVVAFSQDIKSYLTTIILTDIASKAKAPSYQAWCNHNGSHSTRTHPNWNWNIEFLEPVAADLQSPWQDFDEACREAHTKCFRALASLIDGIRDELGGIEDIVLIPSEAFLKSLAPKKVQLQEALDKFLVDVQRFCSDTRLNVITDDTDDSYLLKALSPVYEACGYEFGRGSYARRKALLQYVFSQGEPFAGMEPGIKTAIESDLDARIEKLVGKVHTILDVLLSDFDSMFAVEERPNIHKKRLRAKIRAFVAQAEVQTLVQTFCIINRFKTLLYPPVLPTSASAALTPLLPIALPMAHAGQDPSATLQGLFASLRPSGSRSSSASHPAPRPADDSSAQNIRSPHPYPVPSPFAASSSPRPEPHTINQPFAPSLSNVNERSFSQNGPMSNPTASTGDQTSNERTANLLNLLKFGASTSTGQGNLQQQSTARPGTLAPNTHSVHGRGISASDLVGSFMGKPATPVSRENMKPSASANNQDALLKLLNRSAPTQLPKPSVSQDDEGVVKNLSQDLAETSLNRQAPHSSEDESRKSRKESPIRYFGTPEAQPTPFKPQDMPGLASTPKQEPLFTYVNPFEQLAASSPRNARGATPTGDRHKRKTKEPTPEPPTSRRKITPAGNEILQSIESPGPTPLGDGRTQVEALLGIGAPTKDAETVAEALNEVGNKVDQEAEAALAKAEAKADEMEHLADTKREELERAQKATLDAMAEQVHEVAREVKHELDKKENEGVLEEAMPSPVAEALRNIIDDAAQDNPAEAWESDEGEESQGQETPGDDRIIYVYQFPLKPFVSIDIKKKDHPIPTIRVDAITHIARLRKDFDQIDRTLATATNEFIVYASPKPGGLRIIRQDDGLAKHLFTNTRDRIFNVSISTVPRSGQGSQSVLATGVSGTVYWATILKPNANIFEESLDNAGFAFPPTNNQAQNMSGGQLKTRAKRSSRRPEIFAIGRGKAIHIISAHHAIHSDHLLGGETIGEGNVLDMDNYLEDRSLRIATGKAGKDFTFSEDDSVILSLDKSGRLKFWNIVDLVNCATDPAPKMGSIELKTPGLTFATATPSEKLSPTSVMLVDKQRSYVKGIAQRYALVGMKQNHVLQLWDLGLLKIVQELNFPHDQETDAICSVAFHPSSGIVILGHPTRNSIYFIHLSAPRYNLPSMSQAYFIQRLASKDSTLPRPEATAIMSGLREYSFDSIGHIRSVDLVAIDESRRAGDDESDPPLFELYVMHSKGVTSLSVNKADLGWSLENKVLHPIDAELEKHIVVKDLREPSPAAMSEHSSVNGDAVTPRATAMMKSTPKDTSRSAKTPRRNPSETKKENKAASEASPNAERVNAASSAASHGNEDNKAEKKKKKKRDAAATNTPSAADTAPQADEAVKGPPQAGNPSIAPPQPAQPAEQANSREVPENTRSTRQMPNGESINIGISGEFLDKELKKIEHSVSAEFKRVFAHELETLYRRIDDDKRVQSAAGAAKQDAMLRLVSATLGENVEKSLSRIIQTNIQQNVVPAIGDLAGNTINRTLTDTIPQQLHHAIPPLLKLALPEAVSRGVQNPDVLRLLSDQLTSKLTSHVEREFSSGLHSTIMPAFHNLADNVAQKAAKETEARVQEKLKQADSQHLKDSVKIDQLTDLVRGLSETVHAMAAAQSDFQQEILKLQQQVIQDRRTSSGGTGSVHGASAASRESNTVLKSPEQEALESVASLVEANRYEEATIQWLQSEFQNYIFDGYLAQIDPRYLRDLSPLLNLSVSAAVTSSLEASLAERLTWLETVFATINPGVGSNIINEQSVADLFQDPELYDVGSRIMEVLRERLESGFMHITMNNADEPSLRRIPPLAHQTREFLRYFR